MPAVTVDTGRAACNLPGVDMKAGDALQMECHHRLWRLRILVSTCTSNDLRAVPEIILGGGGANTFLSGGGRVFC